MSYQEAMQQSKYRNFVMPSRDVRIKVDMTPEQYQSVMVWIARVWPELRQLNANRQAQIVAADGWVRVMPINGGQLPETLTTDIVSRIISDELAGQQCTRLWGGISEVAL